MTARPRLRALLARLPAAPLRYYGDWDRLPPDCDSLGLFLTLAAQLGGVAPAKVAAWLSVLRPSLREGGHTPPRLSPGPGGPRSGPARPASTRRYPPSSSGSSWMTRNRDSPRRTIQ